MSPILDSIGSVKAYGWGSFASVPVPTSFESIATVAVGSGGASSVTFSSIPGTYTHLQVRAITRSDLGNSLVDSFSMRFNGDTGSNYNYAILGSTTTTVYRSIAVNQGAGVVGAQPSASHTAGVFAGFIIDILDYANTNKKKTARCIGGVDTNNQGTEKGEPRITGILWNSTSTITSISFASSGSFDRGLAQYSHFALYGIKGVA